MSVPATVGLFVRSVGRRNVNAIALAVQRLFVLVLRDAFVSHIQTLGRTDFACGALGSSVPAIVDSVQG